MIVYGSKSKLLAKETLIDKCPGCGKQHSVDMHVIQKYAHVFWIPFFPMGKTGISQCTFCKQVLKLKEMPPDFVSAYETIKAQTKAPIWMFSGIGLVAVLVTVGVISAQNENAENAKRIAAPQEGDILEIRHSSKQYTLFRIDGVRGDSVYIRIHNYETNKMSGLDDLKEKGISAYSTETYGFTKTELKRMLDDGEIIDVDRK